MIEAIKEQLEQLSQDIAEGQEKLREEVTEKGQTLKDVQEEIVEMDNKRAELEDRLAELEKQMLENGRLPNGDKLDDKEDFGFKNLGEFVQAAYQNSKDNPKDERLKKLGDWMKKELAVDPGEAGGFLIPEQFGEMLDVFQPQNAIFRPRARVIPAGPSPDAKINFPALDQGGKGVYAGVQTEWIEEGANKPETDFDFREITLEPKEVAAHIPVTDKLLRNAPAVAGTINQMLTWALAKAEDVAFWEGDGAGKPLGLYPDTSAKDGYHNSVLSVDRQNSGEIKYEDIANMFGKIIHGRGGQYYWLVSHQALPQLMQLEDGANQLIWQPNAREASPGSLIGLPVIVNERQPDLGDTADLAIVDFGYYYIKDGVGPMIASSEHVEFLKNKTVIKAFQTVDGQPAITEPLELENGEDASPFVFLNEDHEA